MKPRKRRAPPNRYGRRGGSPFLAALLRYRKSLIGLTVGAYGLLLYVLLNDLGPQSQVTATTSPAIQHAASAPTVTTAAAQGDTSVWTVRRDAQDYGTALPGDPAGNPAGTSPGILISTSENTSDSTLVTTPVNTAGSSPAITAASPVQTVETVVSPAHPQSVEHASEKFHIALIIDDIGNSNELGARAVALPGAVTYAVLPHTPFGTELAELAHSKNKEIMLHAPMSNVARMPLGPGALTDNLSRDEFMTTLLTAIDAVPYLQGINNHMGSELTGLETQMEWVMEALKARKLYFVDSLTTAQSVAGRIAREQQVPTVTRNVFLDNETTPESIDAEFQRLLQLAREKGSAVGIGHPYKETLDYLEKAIPELARQNIELISVSDMIRLQQSPAATPAL